jgi:hypothetical protein
LDLINVMYGYSFDPKHSKVCNVTQSLAQLY